MAYGLMGYCVTAPRHQEHYTLATGQAKKNLHSTRLQVHYTHRKGHRSTNVGVTTHNSQVPTFDNFPATSILADKGHDRQQ